MSMEEKHIKREILRCAQDDSKTEDHRMAKKTSFI